MSLRQYAARLAFGEGGKKRTSAGSKHPKIKSALKTSSSPTLMEIAEGGAAEGVSAHQALVNAGHICHTFGERCTNGWSG